MYNQPENILEKYDIQAEQISRGRGSYLCTTAEGVLVLAPFKGSRERAAFLSGYMDYLRGKGFETEKIYLTAEGEPLAEDQTGTRYILKSLIRGSECSTRRKEEMKEAAGLLAGYHRLAEECDMEIPGFLAGGLTRTELCRKHIRQLVQVKNYIKNRRQKNPFDERFAASYPHFIGCAEKALGQLEALEGGKRLLCHGNYNQHNVLRTAEGCRIVGFERLAYDSPMADLSTFIRKMLEKNSWKPELGRELVEAYHRCRPISEEERRSLETYLLFPEKFWKIANHYSSSHKAWISTRDVEKLERVIAQEEARQAFLEDIVHSRFACEW